MRRVVESITKFLENPEFVFFEMKELSPARPKEIEPSQRALRIGIVGAMASGKSTLANLLGEEWGVTPIRERWRENPFLEAFYDNSEEKGISFNTQTCFLTLKAEDMMAPSKKEKENFTPPQVKIFDTTDDTDAAYIWTQAVIGLMSIEEFKTLRKLHRTFKENIVPIDIYVFPDAKADVLLGRILDKRKRDFEHPEFFENYPNYLELLSSFTREWCKTISYEHPVVFVDTVNNNFADDKKTGEKIVMQVEDRIRDFFMKNPYAIKDEKVFYGRDGAQIIVPDFLKTR